MSDKRQATRSDKDMSEALMIPPAGDNEMAKFVDRCLDGLQSENSRRAYRRSISAFVKFMADRREPLSKGLMNEFKATMEAAGRGDAAINSALTAARFFIREAAQDGKLDPVEAERACKVKNIAKRGKRAGNWLTPAQAEALISAPDTSTALGLRDRAILACLLGAGLRRAECASLTVDRFQQREGRWVICDLIGKRNKVRTIPIAGWTKAIADLWLTSAGITSGLVFRQASWSREAGAPGAVAEAGLSEQGIYRVCLRYGLTVDAPMIRPHDLRRTFAKLSHLGGGKLAQISLNLGHESLAVTQTYLGLELDYQDSAADHLGLTVKL
jgi:integrase